MDRILSLFIGADEVISKASLIDCVGPEIVDLLKGENAVVDLSLRVETEQARSSTKGAPPSAQNSGAFAKKNLAKASHGSRSGNPDLY